jgi:hypothetical protein
MVGLVMVRLLMVGVLVVRLLVVGIVMVRVIVVRGFMVRLLVVRRLMVGVLLVRFKLVRRRLELGPRPSPGTSSPSPRHDDARTADSPATAWQQGWHGEFSSIYRRGAFRHDH